MLDSSLAEIILQLLDVRYGSARFKFFVCRPLGILQPLQFGAARHDVCVSGARRFSSTTEDGASTRSPSRFKQLGVE